MSLDRSARLERICRGKLKERQLGIAKKQYIGQITLAMESNESYMLSAARSCLIYDSVDGLDELHAKIRSITAAQIAEVAEEIFSEPGIVDAAVQMTMNDLERYIEAHIAPEDELLRELDRETHLSVVQPRMLSGHMQGRLLEMLVRMLAPKRILEIARSPATRPFALARGLPVGGELHTIEVDDELEAIAARYFARSGCGDRISTYRLGARSGSGARPIRPDLYRRRQARISGLLPDGHADARPQRKLSAGRQHPVVR